MQNDEFLIRLDRPSHGRQASPGTSSPHGRQAKATPEHRQALEESIRRHLADGDIAAATVLIIHGYGHEILGFLTNMMDDADGAKDVYSEVTENMWHGLSTFEPRAMVRTWLYCIARNACARYYRDPYMRRGTRLTTDAQNLLKESTDSFFAKPVRPSESVARIRKLLSPEEREILTLRIDREMRWTEIATILGTNAATARQRFHRVKDRLRILLTQDRHEHDHR